MQYAIELYFNKELEEKIQGLAQKVADKNLSTKFLEWKTRPHITLACFNDVDEAKCARLLEDFAKNHKDIPAFINSVGMFTDTKVVFLSPMMTKNMYQLQGDLHEALKEFDARGWEWYLPDSWVPHCTVALTGGDKEDIFYQASELVLREFEKMEGKYASIGLVKITFPVTEIKTFYFGE